jgi:predicted RNA-binding Zn ribbon-like protein
VDTRDPFGKGVGGRLCLDFVNTVQSRVHEPGAGRTKDYRDRIVGERLESYESLTEWAALAGAVTDREARALARQAASHLPAAASVLKRCLAAREAMYRLFKAGIEDWAPGRDDLAAFNHEVRIARAHEQLVASPRFGWEWDRSSDALDRVLWPIVRSAVDLLTSPDLARVGQCPAADCGWLFLDTSRAGRRQWCDMADCGNLAKVQRFRQRRRAPGRRRRLQAS